MIGASDSSWSLAKKIENIQGHFKLSVRLRHSLHYIYEIGLLL